MQTHKNSAARRARRARTRARPSQTLPQPSVVDVDPGDPSQQLDEAGEFHVVPLEVEALPEAEADADTDLAVELAEEEGETDLEDEEYGLEPGEEPTAEQRTARAKDRGDLYGVHTPPATDTDVAPDRPSQSTDGETWTEELLAHAAEGGAVAEHELDVTEEAEDPHWGHHGTESRDRPVADKGAGGRGGL